MAGHGPLETECPFCGTYVGHDITATDSTKYNWNKERGAFFTEIVGRDIPYRKRTKQCAKCHSFFDTYEMWHKFLTALMEQTSRLENENASLQSNLLKLEETVEAQQEQLEEMTAIIHRTPAIL